VLGFVPCHLDTSKVFLMRFQSRLQWFALLSLLLVVCIVATPLLLIYKQQQQEHDALLLDDYRSSWDTSIEAVGAAISAQQVGRDANVVQPLIVPGSIPVERVDYLDANFQRVAGSLPLQTQASLMNPEIMVREIQLKGVAQGLSMVMGAQCSQMYLVASRPWRQRGYVSVAAKPEVLTNALKNGIRGHFFLVDRAGVLHASSTEPFWREVQPFYTETVGVQDLAINEVSYSMAVLPIHDYTGYRIASLVVLQDVTLKTKEKRFILLFAGLMSLVLFTMLALLLRAIIRHTVQPLEQLTQTIHALSHGDLFTPLPQRATTDEVGAIAKAVAVFQIHALALARRDFTDALERRNTRQLIEAEMQKIAGVLEPAEQKALQIELQAEHSLATSFKLLAARVVEQQTRLQALLQQRSDDVELLRNALEERSQLTRLREELALASQLQISSLPRAEVAAALLPGIELHAQMRPAKEVGGDFYDYQMLDAHNLMLVVGDASGKGISAAMFVLMTRTLLRAHLSLDKTPAQALFETNCALERDNQSMAFTTVFLGILNLHTGVLQFANAGHNPPYWVRAQGEAVRLDQVADVMLGVMPDVDYSNASITLVPGDMLWLYSDGVTEAHNPEQDLFGEARMVEQVMVARQLPVQTVVQQMLHALDGFAASSEQFDDITLLACRYHGGTPRN
jgi:sigma-B regulation protein RsbU (phosphoserine phosphatase)